MLGVVIIETRDGSPRSTLEVGESASIHSAVYLGVITDQTEKLMHVTVHWSYLSFPRQPTQRVGLQLFDDATCRGF